MPSDPNQYTLLSSSIEKVAKIVSAFYGCDNQTFTLGDKPEEFCSHLDMGERPKGARVINSRYSCYFAGSHDAASNYPHATYSSGTI